MGKEITSLLLGDLFVPQAVKERTALQVLFCVVKGHFE